METILTDLRSHLRDSFETLTDYDAQVRPLADRFMAAIADALNAASVHGKVYDKSTTAVPDASSSQHLGALQANSGNVHSLAAAVAHDTSTDTSDLATVGDSSVSPTDTSGAALPSTPATRAELSQTMKYIYDLAVAQNEHISHVCAHGSDKTCHLPLPPF